MVGAGNICHAHLSAYRHDPRVEIVAICDIDFDRCNRTADEFGIPNRYKSVHEMVADKALNLQAGDVCVWNCAHAECSIACLDAGLDTLCEKPMAMNAKEAEDMLEASKRNGKLLMLGFVTRFATDSKIAKDFIDKGLLGDIYYSKATYIRRNGNPGGWFCDKERSGGGPLIDGLASGRS